MHALCHGKHPWLTGARGTAGDIPTSGTASSGICPSRARTSQFSRCHSRYSSTAVSSACGGARCSIWSARVATHQGGGQAVASNPCPRVPTAWRCPRPQHVASSRLSRTIARKETRSARSQGGTASHQPCAGGSARCPPCAQIARMRILLARETARCGFGEI